jgi:hypothetical protein
MFFSLRLLMRCDAVLRGPWLAKPQAAKVASCCIGRFCCSLRVELKKEMMSSLGCGI